LLPRFAGDFRLAGRDGFVFLEREEDFFLVGVRVGIALGLD